METWTLNKLHIFPIIYVLWLITGMLICFWVAYGQGHVSIYVPFISETGGKLPERGILTFFFCTGAFLGFFSMLIRYLIIYKMNSQRSKLINIINKIALFVGCISFFGLITAGCYPVYSVIEMHNAGAVMWFLGELFYEFIQMLLSLIMQPRIYRSRIFQIRLAICIFSLLFFIGMIVPLRKIPQDWFTYDKIMEIANKMPGDERFELLLTSTICEWMLTFSFLSFFISFITDFRMFTINISIREDSTEKST